MLPVVEEFLVKLFINTNSFLYLHFLTGFCSFKKVLPFFSDKEKEELLEIFLIHALAGYSIDSSEYEDIRVINDPLNFE